MRVKANYTFEEEVKNEFDRICKEKSINKSAWLEKKIKEFIKENSTKDKS